MPNNTIRNISSSDPFELAEEMTFGDIHFKHDKTTGLKAIIAIHNTDLGPAVGGCRFAFYQSTQDALYDAMRLAQGMSYKAAITGLTSGGGKSVIIRPQEIGNRKKLFAAFGDFVEQLGGRYVTAVDSGTSVDDMNIVATRTKHVSSTSRTGDPSPYTALGVRRGMQAALKAKYQQDDLSNKHVVIQGIGHVGYYLAKELHVLGARLTYSDVNAHALHRVISEFGGESVSPDAVYDVACDVFAPCALGGTLNVNTVNRLQTKIIVGAANNQLASPEIAELLHRKNILYAPDYVVNAGGLIQITLLDETKVRHKVNAIYATVLDIFNQSRKTGLATAITADNIAQEIIKKAGAVAEKMAKTMPQQ